MDNIIDLHIHSTASDGTCTPTEIIKQGLKHSKKNGVPVTMALTDHDTISGVQEFLTAAKKYPKNIQAFAGVEISSYFEKEEIHVLAYGIDVNDELLLKSLEKYRDMRDQRNVEIIQKLNENGMNISLDDIQPEKEGDSIGRPVIARQLLKMGYVSSVKEAFDRYLAKGQPCYVAMKKPSLEEIMELIHKCGGTAVLAHPVLYKKLSSEQLNELISMLKDMGLKGLEVYYSRNTPEDTAYYESLAKEYGLYSTCGSDYHGTVKPDISLFYGEGDLLAASMVQEEFIPTLQ